MAERVATNGCDGTAPSCATPVVVAKGSSETKPKLLKSLESIKTNTEKAEEEFRVYSEETSLERVVNHYRNMRLYQTVDFYRRMEQKYTFDNGQYRKLMTMDQAFDELEHYVVRVSYIHNNTTCFFVCVEGVLACLRN
jgi:hypothetical protein